MSKRKSHFKLQTVLFKRGLERNSKTKKFLEFDVEKDYGIIFYKKIMLKKDNSFKCNCGICVAEIN